MIAILLLAVISSLVSLIYFKDKTGYLKPIKIEGNKK